MINGTLSRILYIGAIGIVALCIVGSVVLAFGTSKSLPTDAQMALYTCLGFLFGSHVVPPTVKKITDATGHVIGREPGATYERKAVPE